MLLLCVTEEAPHFCPLQKHTHQCCEGACISLQRAIGSEKTDVHPPDPRPSQRNGCGEAGVVGQTVRHLP